MIYSINEGLLDKFKKKKDGNTTKEEFDSILKTFSELEKKFEGSIISASKRILERNKYYEDNDERYDRNYSNFMKGKPVRLYHSIAFKENYKGHENEELDIEAVINTTSNIIKSCGFSNIEDTGDNRSRILASNSNKYPNIKIEVFFDDIFVIDFEYTKNPVRLLKKTSAKHESTIFDFDLM